MSAVILGRKNCSRCSRWLHVTEFSPVSHDPLKLRAQCRACTRRYKAKWTAEHPGRSTEWSRSYRERHPERARARASAYMKGYRERRKQDPERYEAFLVNQRAYYHVYYHRARALSEIRGRFMGRLLGVLYLELVRREQEARAWREYKRGLAQALVARRRAAFEAGEVPDEPVFDADGALVRLPVLPLARWLEGHNLEELAHRVGVDPKALRRYSTGEAEMVPLEMVDAIVTRSNVLMFEIYPEDRYPGLYEFPEDD